MIKNTLAVAFIFLLNSNVFAQGEANNWFFGGGAGLVFDNINGTVTPTAAASQTINTLEGCSSISDPNGNPTEEYSDTFTSVPGGDDGFNNGLNYSLVDMTLNKGMIFFRLL